MVMACAVNSWRGHKARVLPAICTGAQPFAAQNVVRNGSAVATAAGAAWPGGKAGGSAGRGTPLDSGRGPAAESPARARTRFQRTRATGREDLPMHARIICALGAAAAACALVSPGLAGLAGAASIVSRASGLQAPARDAAESAGAAAGSAASHGRPARPVIAYVLNANSVTPIRTTTGKAGEPIKITVPGPPEILRAIAITPDGKTVYVANHGFDTAPADTVIPISTATGKAGKPITVGASPDAIAITPDGRTAYVVSESGTVTPIRTATGKAITVGSNPVAIAITPDGKTAYIVNSNSGTVTPIRAATGKAGKAGNAVKVGSGPPAARPPPPTGRTAHAPNYTAGPVPPIPASPTPAGKPIKVGSGPGAIAIT